MSRRRLITRYLELKHAIEREYGHLPWDTAALDRLTEELSTIERQLASDRRVLAY